MLISEFAREAGITRDAVRHYHKIGMLTDEHFTVRENGYREYNQKALERVAFIKGGQRAGFTLSQLKTVAGRWKSNLMPVEEKRNIMQKQIAQIDAKIKELQALKAEVCLLLEEIEKQSS